MRKLLFVLALLLVSVQAQAQISLPKVFVAKETIKAAEVNANFAALANAALNKTGDTITGNIQVNNGITIDGVNLKTLRTTGNPTFADVTADTYTGLGIGLTSIPETAISDGTLLARLAHNETVAGAWTFAGGATGTFSGTGTGLTLDASKLTSGTVPLARLTGITNTQLAASAGIALTKLGDGTGNISQWVNDSAYLTTVTDATVAVGAAIDLAKLGNGTKNVSQWTNDSGYLTSASNLNAAKLSSGTVPLARLSGITTTQMASANISQFTNDSGYITSSSGVPAGSIVFTTGACSAGWTDISATYAGRYIVVGGTIGNTVGTALTNGENRTVGPHSHTITDPGHFHTYYVHDDGGTGNLGFEDYDVKWSLRNTSTKTTDISINQTGTNISTTAGTNAPYVQLRACQKD